MLVIVIAWHSGDASFQDVLVAIFCPSFRYGLGGPDFVEDDVGETGHDEAREEIETVDICSADGDGLTDGSGKANNIDYDSEDIGNLKSVGILGGGTYALGLIPMRYQYGPSRCAEYRSGTEKYPL